MSRNHVKRVKPYPFKGEIKESATVSPCKIIMLPHSAVLLEVMGGSVQPGDKVEVSFLTPVLGQPVQFNGIVVKVYNQLAGATAPIHRLEIHFATLTRSTRTILQLS